MAGSGLGGILDLRPRWYPARAACRRRGDPASFPSPRTGADPCPAPPPRRPDARRPGRRPRRGGRPPRRLRRGGPNPAFAAKLDGTASERATHLGRHDRAFTEVTSGSGRASDAVKETFVAYTGAVIETADTILDDPEASPEDATKAAE